MKYVFIFLFITILLDVTNVKTTEVMAQFESEKVIDSNGTTALILQQNGMSVYRPQKRIVAEVVMAVMAVIQIGIGIFKCIMNRKIIKMQQKMIDQMANNLHEQNAFNQKVYCAAKCVSEWSRWSLCDKPCGGGKRYRSRSVTTLDFCKGIKGISCPASESLSVFKYCNTACKNGGSANNGVCTCKAGYKGRCCGEDYYCRELYMANGTIRAKSPHKHRSVAEFSCNYGFKLDEDTSHLTCFNGSWGGLEPTCSEMYCDPPKLGTNVILRNGMKEKYNIDDEIYYKCEEGYVLFGPEKRKCKKSLIEDIGKWTELEPECNAVSCGYPGEPYNGQMSGSNFDYGDVVHFKCNPGYTLIGSVNMECFKSGKWYGHFPQCINIQCEPPYLPRNGFVHVERDGHDQTAVYGCDDGYTMEGNSRIACLEGGYWEGSFPTCYVIKCIDPGSPQNGYQEGLVHTYPHKVRYYCYDGYHLVGNSDIQCKKDGRWSGLKPRCEACPIGTFSNNGICTNCPLHTTTKYEGSRSREHCFCEYGFKGPHGGPCEELACSPLSAPENGMISDCDETLDSKCEFSCDAGYFLSSGDRKRTCTVAEHWDGTEAHCSACPLDTYRTDGLYCLPCPANSGTMGLDTIGSITGCMCENGYEGPDGGPCRDRDECAENDGHGLCEDRCENIEGGYVCHCTIAGYEQDPEDKNKCIVKDQCRNLTRDDAPGHGALTCSWIQQHNSIYCEVLCNPGYEFMTEMNSYETCGPSTGFVWSFKIDSPSTNIEPCIEEFFSDVRLEADSCYLVHDCEQLTEDEKRAVKENFAEKLNSNKVCEYKDDKICSIDTIDVICGKVTYLMNTYGHYEPKQFFHVNYNISSKSKAFLDCPEICEDRKVPLSQCTKQLCHGLIKRKQRASVMYAQEKLKDIYKKSPHKMEMNVNSMTYSPLTVEVSEPQLGCSRGMVARGDTCGLCPQGTYYEAESKGCLDCPLGTYQLLTGQTKCEICPEGSTTYQKRSLFCEACPAGFKGMNCQEEISCQHGAYNDLYETCVCDPQWTGGDCDIKLAD